MELIKFKKDGGGVSIRISIVGLVAWRSVYVADEKKFVNNSQSLGPTKHLLGFPHDLQNDVHSWDIQLGNPSDDKQSYKIEIEWEQDENQLHVWTRKGELPKDKAKVEMDDALLVGT
jgi:hypothetical protein